MAAQPTPPPSRPRSGLQRVRDVALTVMAVVVPLFVLFALYVSLSVGSFLAEMPDRWNEPVPAPTFDFDEPVPTNSLGEECIGDEPPPGC